MKPETPIVAIGEILWDLLPGGRRAGGAPFNFAFHCHQLGHSAAIVSRVGDDDLGRDLRVEVRRLGMSDKFIQTDPEHPTGTVRVELDAGGQPTYTIAEDVAWDFITWEPRLDNLAESASAVCFGTLAQRQQPSRVAIQRFVSRVHIRQRPVVLDLNLRPPFHTSETIRLSASMADCVKLNEHEFDQLPGNSIVRAAMVLCVTRGPNGCWVRIPTATVDVPGIPIQVADSVGAGDAFTAAFLTKHLEGKPLADAARFANAYATVVVSKPGGTPTVTRAEVERLL